MSYNKKKTFPPFSKSLFICFLGALFYLYEYILQVSPAVMTNQIMASFGVGAVGLSSISAAYYYAYAPMQLPAGLLYDRFGPRKLLSIAALICAAGTFLWSMSDDVIMATYGRFLMGAGSAFAFIGTLVLITRWFHPKYFAFLAGLTQLLSSIGALVGGVPLAHAVIILGWRRALIMLSVFGIILSILLYTFVRNYPPNAKHFSSPKRQSEHSIKGLGKIVKNSQVWSIAGYAFAVWAPITFFAALWGVPYIEAAYHVSTPIASSAISMIWVGIAVGSPLGGWFSEKIRRRCTVLSLGAILGILASILILYVKLPFYAIYFVLFLLGISVCGQTLGFAVINDIIPMKSMGTAIGFTNVAVVLGGALFQPLVGILLHFFWKGTMFHGAPIYSFQAFQKALFIMPFCYVTALIISWLCIKETYCRPIRTQTK